MKIAITGASGLVGTALREVLRREGHTAAPIVRHAARPGEISWDPERGQIDAAALEDFDAVVHLAGENIAARRWSREQKERIRRSRVEGTRLIAETLAKLQNPPKTLISASAVGIYGDRGDEVLTETAPPGEGFLPMVGRQWEEAAQPARDAGIRVVHPRIAVALSARGGALQKMLTPFRLGLAGPLGNGHQWMSWICLEDLARALHFLLMHPDLSGAFNATAPQPVTNAEFTRALARLLHRPAFLRVPAFALRAALGELGSVLLESTRAVPERLQVAGFEFSHPTLEHALRAALAAPRGN